jgi:TonB family protein
MELSSNWLSYLAGVSVRSLCFAAIALAAILIFRIRTAGARHAVWTVVMSAMLLLAVLTPVLPPLNLPLLRAAPATVPAVIDLSPAQPRQLAAATLPAPSARRAPAAYPGPARRDRIEGTVTLEVTIGEDGAVEKAVALEGHPVLATAAEDAIREWKYQPTLLTGSRYGWSPRLRFRFV